MRSRGDIMRHAPSRPNWTHLQRTTSQARTRPTMAIKRLQWQPSSWLLFPTQGQVLPRRPLDGGGSTPAEVLLWRDHGQAPPPSHPVLWCKLLLSSVFLASRSLRG